ncbi:MAG: hypothetical protein ABI480_08070 [Chitinophagaceae bacterium]
MASYLLLRSNKETGPFNLEDLIKAGLKAYDLVWVQGKSAAWRYPGEIEELKPYAPLVEEQPYDRFYKKNTEAAKEQSQPIVQDQSYQKTFIKEEPQPVEEQQSYQKTFVKEEEPAIEEKYAKYIPKKSVFVTLPGQKTAVVVQRPVQPVQPEPDPEPTIIVTENPAAQIKYSQPLDEIKEMYVKTLQERKNKIARKTFALASLKKVAVVAGLILLGLLAGFLIKSNSGKDMLATQAVQQPSQTQIAANVPVPVPTNQETTTQQTDKNIAVTTPPVIQASDPAPTVINMPPAMKARLIREERKQYEDSKVKKDPGTQVPSVTQTFSEPISRPLSNDPVSGERNRQVRDNQSNTSSNTTDTKPFSTRKKSPIGSQVSVTTNDYKRVAFGGIRNLEVTVTNDSKFMLDKVIVELEYLKPNELPLRTETIQFHTISANGSSTIKLPDTNRGIKVLYKIVDIQSAQSETALSGF